MAVTAYAMVGDHERAIAAGFDMHVSKPIDPAGFMAMIQPLLPVRTAAATAHEERSERLPMGHATTSPEQMGHDRPVRVARRFVLPPAVGAASGREV